MQNHAQDAKGRGRPPKQRGNKLLTREMLVHVGTEVLTEKGYSAVGVDEILQRTGISRCSFYYYFKTKEGFGAELIDRYRHFITQKLERCLSDTSLSPLGSLRTFVGEVRDEDGADRLPFRLSGRKAGAGGQHVAGKLPRAAFRRLRGVAGCFRARPQTCPRDWRNITGTGLCLYGGLLLLRLGGSLQRANLELNIKTRRYLHRQFLFPADGITLPSP